MTRLEFICLVFGERCFYCEQEFPLALLTRDHVVPRCEGGSDQWENQVPACQPCNQRKGRRMPTADELARVRTVWASGPTAKIKKRHAPPCDVCNGNVAALDVNCCPSCGRLPTGHYIVPSFAIPLTA